MDTYNAMDERKAAKPEQRHIHPPTKEGPAKKPKQTLCAIDSAKNATITRLDPPT